MAKRSSRWNNTLAAAQPLVRVQGEIVYAFNQLHERFFFTFMIGLGLEMPSKIAMDVRFYSYALALWNVVPSDSVQRQLSLIAISEIPTTLNIRDGIAALKWAKERADDLAVYRNIVAHNPISFVPKPNKPFFDPMPRFGGGGTKSKHADRIAKIKSVRFWQTVRNDFLNLAEYVDFVGRQIQQREYEREHGPVVGARHTWPRKPRLRSVPQSG
jgi:hypothetical protein